jgi:hypothetical protein
MKTTDDETAACKKCAATVSTLAVFPGGICVTCYAKKFDAQVARNGGTLPRPDFTRSLNK